MHFHTENEIRDLVKKFEAGAIAREDWHHREHLVVALVYFLETESVSQAIEKMRAGILNYLRAIKADLGEEHPYHETLTVFWITVIAGFLRKNKKMNLTENVDAVLNRFSDKDLPLQFYSRECLFSELARKEYLEPDRQPLFIDDL